MPFALLPALDGADVTPEVGRNVFPRFQPVGGLFRGEATAIGSWVMTTPCSFGSAAVEEFYRRTQSATAHRIMPQTTDLLVMPRFTACAPASRRSIFGAGQRPEALPQTRLSAAGKRDTQMARHRIQRNRHRLIVTFLATVTLLTSRRSGRPRRGRSLTRKPDQVLEWNQVFIDTLIATNTPNAASQRLGAIVHTAIFDAYNGIERRYTPVFVHDAAPRGASRRAAVIAAAYTALVRLFPTREPQLRRKYAASLAALSDDDEDGGRRASEESSGAPRWPKRCSRGARAIFTPTAVHWRHRRWPMADDGELQSAGGHDGAVAGLHRYVRPGQQQAVPARAAARFYERHKADFDAVKMLGRGDRTPAAPTIRPRWRRSGKATPAFIGTRPPTRLRAPTTCPCPTAACWRC